jgi:hypothetical protein
MAGLLCGVTTLVLLRRFSDQAAIRTAKARIRAHLYELRLFSDDPVLILRANRKLLFWNLRYIKLTLTPVAITAIPAGLLSLQLDALFGKRSMNQGEAVVVTAQLRPPGLDALELVATPSFHIESPPVLIRSLGQACWRVRAIGGLDGRVQVKLPGEVVDVPIRAGPGLRYIGNFCPSSIWGLISEGCFIQSNLAESVAIEYPAGRANWAAWFALSWLAATLMLRRSFGVTF